MTKKPTRTRTGTSLLRALAVLAALAAGAAGQAPSEPVASVIAGTVFREPGFALPGATVVLTELEPRKKKSKPQKVVSDAHGEYAFRLPPSDGRFKLTVTRPGFLSETKETAATPGVRVDVFFQLKADPKPHSR